MNQNQCNSCGAYFEYRNGKWICPACDAIKPEEISNEEVTLLYNAAQKLRVQEFDDAEEAYLDIIQKYPKQHEAYWGYVCSHYGIKMEEDFDGKCVPTCCFPSIDSFLKDKNYKKALEYATEDTKAWYKEKAEYIERVRKEWVEKVKGEEAYDIFISYKDSDEEHGIDRTEDSINALELYNHLARQGYRVFYSRESLRDKIGEKYEPYIFNALNTSKVMILYGSSVDYINSTWVKNEWHRYLKKIENGEKRDGSLLVVCDGFSPNELPKILASKQCLDGKSKKLYVDIDNYLKQLFSKEDKTKEEPKKQIKVSPLHEHVYIDEVVPATCIARGYTLHKCRCGYEYKDNYTELAEHKFEYKTTKEPTCLEPGYKEYVCSVCGEKKRETIPAKGHDFDKWIVKTEATCNNEGLEHRQCKNCGIIEERNIAKKEHKFGAWKNSEDGKHQERVCSHCNYVEKILTEDYKKMRKKKLVKRVSIISLSSIVALVTALIFLFNLILPNANFDKATELFNAGKYEEAMAIYKDLDGFGNSANKISIIEAINTVEDGEYEEGIEKMLENGATVTILYDCNGGELTTTNAMSLLSSNGASLMSAIEENDENIFTYKNLNEFEGLKPSTRNGYVFSNWALVKCTPTIRKDSNKIELNFIAEWSAKSYTITYDLDGGSVDGENIIGYNSDDAEITLINPTRTGYTFIGWTGTDLTDKTMEVTIPSGSYGNREYTANWIANTYTVTYDANGGIASKTSDTATYDKAFNLATAERKGYTFLGWFVGETKYDDFDSWELTNSLDLVAKWTYYTLSTSTNDAKAGTYVVKTNEKITAGESVTITAQTNSGYKWKGWFCNGILKSSDLEYTFAMPEENVNLVAEWNIITYAIDYNLDNGIVDGNTDTYTVNDVITLNNPTRIGYTFTGWTGTDLNDKTMSVTIVKGTVGDRTYTATWSANNYTLTYDVNGGHTLADNTQSVTYDANYSVITPTRTGYSFVKWTTSTGEVYNGGTWKTANDVTVIAQWEAETYNITYEDVEEWATFATVTFDYNYSGSTNFTQKLTNGQKLVYPQTPTRNNFVFTGWYTDTSCKNRYDFNGEIVEDITLYAGWLEMSLACNSEIPVEPYKYTSISDGLYGTTEYTSYDNPENFYFVAEETGTHFISFNNKKYSIHVSCDYLIKNHNYARPNSRTYEPSSGQSYSFYCAKGDVVVISLCYPRSKASSMGEIFSVWFAGFSKPVSNVSASVCQEEGIIRYKEGVTYGESITFDSEFVLPTPIRSGYNFRGWEYNGEEFTNGKWGLTTDITLTAQWEIINYSIDYNLDNGSIAGNPTNYTVEDSITLNNPTREGYTFLGWSGTDINGLSKNVTIQKGSIGNRCYTANWACYTLTTSTNDENAGTYTIKSSEKVTAGRLIALTASTRQGYTWKGWYSNGTLKSSSLSYTFNMPEENVHLVATWEINEYKITYILGGGVGADNPTIYTVEDSITLVNPTRDGYTFIGWSGDYISGNTMSVTIEKGSIGNRSFTANWQAHLNAVIFSNEGNTTTLSAYTDEYVRLPKNTLVKENYEFCGWATTQGGEVAYYDQDLFLMGPNSSYNLYAVWKDRNDWVAISTPEDLNNIRNNLSGKYYLTNDIDLDSYTWVPIGTESAPFCGEIDGNGYIIYNLNKPTATKIWTESIWTGHYYAGIKTYEYHYHYSYGLIGYSNINSSIHDLGVVGHLGNDKLPFDDYSGTDDKIYHANKAILVTRNFGSIYNCFVEGVFDGVENNEIVSSGTGVVENVEGYNALGYFKYCYGDGVNYYQKAYQHSIVTLIDNNVKKPGYTFVGWSLSEGGSVKYQAGDEFFIPIDKTTITLYPVWQANTNEIVFNANGGSGVMANQQVQTDKTVSLNDVAFYKAGYHFIGWSTSSDGEVIYANQDSYKMGTNSSYTLYAIWEANTNEIVFDANGGSGSMSSQQGLSNSTITLNQCTFTAPEFYYFAGWSETSDGSVDYLAGSSYVVGTNSVYTLYAVWEPFSYNINYVANGGEDVEVDTFKYKESISLATPTRDGYTFGGWYTDKDLTNEFALTTMPAQNQTLYAWWMEENKPNDFSYSYVNYNGGGQSITISSLYASNSNITSLTIPSYIGGVPVTTISPAAFKNQSQILNVVVPQTIEMIGDGAFSGCSSITTMTLPFVGFYQRTETDTYQYPLGYIFGTESFSGAVEVEQSYYGSSLGSISRTKYYVPSSLKTVNIMGGNILYGAFYNCTSIERITLPKNITVIGDCAFYNCCNLVEVVNFDQLELEKIGQSTFSSCEKLTGLEFPQTIKSIGVAAFFGCAQLTTVDLSRNVNLKSIENSTFCNCSSLNELSLPISVISIGESAFLGCSSLTELTLSDSLINIRNSAFSGCSALLKINSCVEGELIIPNGVETIGSNAFADLVLIKKIVVPSSVKSIGNGAFNGCEMVEDVTLPFVGAGEEAIRDYQLVFGYVFGCVENRGYAIEGTVHQCDYWYTSTDRSFFCYYIPKTIKTVIIVSQTEIPNNAFKNCDFISQITILSEINKINDYAFYNCRSLTGIEIGDSVVSIGEYAFSGCTLLAKINSNIEGELVCPKQLVSIGDYAFQNLNLITKIILSQDISSINKEVFDGCNSVETIVLPDDSLIDVWSGNIEYSFAGGDGSEESPYLISNAEQLAYIASSVNQGINNFEGKYLKLVSNIHLWDIEWIPIGNETYQFKGHFDGDGNSIYGLKSTSSEYYAGFFGYVNCGSIKNVLIIDAELNLHSSVAGILVGYIYNPLETSIEKCYVSGKIFNYENGLIVGGIAGKGGKIVESISEATVYGCTSGSSSSIFRYVYAGGIAGQGSAVNCYTTGKVTAGGSDLYRDVGYVGGVLGSGSVENCYSTAIVVCSTNKAGYAGGIVGSSSSVKNSFSVGDVSVSTHYKDEISGRIVAEIEDSSKVENCYADGTQTISGSAYTYCSLQFTVTLQSEDFIYNTLGWSADVWQINNGAFPTLK